MLFAVICEDKPEALELRMATRPAHLEYIDAQAAAVVQGGPMLDAAGKPCGSLLLVDLPDEAAAQRFAAEDPYAKAGLFAKVTVRAFRQVFAGGARVGG